MSVWKCQSCNATYSDVQPDGMLYFHACSPAPPNAQGVQAPLPNPRNENIVMDGRGRAIGIKAAGAGVIGVGVTATPVPVTLPPAVPINP